MCNDTEGVYNSFFLRGVPDLKIFVSAKYIRYNREIGSLCSADSSTKMIDMIESTAATFQHFFYIINSLALAAGTIWKYWWKNIFLRFWTIIWLLQKRDLLHLVVLSVFRLLSFKVYERESLLAVTIFPIFFGLNNI